MAKQKTKGEKAAEQHLHRNAGRLSGAVYGGAMDEAAEIVSEGARLRDAMDNNRPKGGNPGHEGKPPLIGPLTDGRGPNGEAVERNANHCTVCWLLSRKQISGLQHKAAEKLQDDRDRAGLSSYPSTLAALAAHGGGSGNTVEAMMAVKADASSHLHDALSAVGTSGRFLLEKIVLGDMTATDVAKIYRVDKQAVVPSLCVALDALVRHYRLQVEAPESSPIRVCHPFARHI